MIPPPVTQASIRAEVKRQLKARGFAGYTPNPPACRPYDGPRCAEDDCETPVRQEGWRCHVCSARANEVAAAKRKAEAAERINARARAKYQKRKAAAK